ncbi:poly-beta-1,6 N-acetyl-D-glucosamine export porin PgaA [Pistricoccus aurantiacus]|uniref:poly-beta-1,6 N-acetyl-D-glucosamine export porin PgaA n=1 Tax=Pistricoccus aurantiacus TaxID=1883414 RepID=UPI00363CED6D
MNKTMRMLTCCLWGLTAFGMENALAQTGSLDSQREAWVIMAREGQRDKAIDGLSQLYARTGDQAVLDDLIALLIRAERYAEALNVCGDCTAASYSATSLEALGLAARQTGNTQQAQIFYRTLTQRQPDNLQGWLGLVLVDIEQGAYLAAGYTLQIIKQRFGVSDDWLRTRLRLANQRNDVIDELRTRERLVRRNPESVQDIQALYQLAMSIGARNAAKNLLRDHPEAFSATDLQWLSYYDAVDKIRLADNTNRPQRAREALQELDALIDTPNINAELLKRAQYDKVVALVLLRRFAEAETLASRLEARDGELPAYVKRARADALSGLGKPDQAIEIYQGLAASRPQAKRDINQPLNASLIYAYADAQRYDDAQAVLDEWQGQEPDSRWDFTGVTRIDNPNYEQTRQFQVLLPAWRGDEARASRRIDDLLERAPGNASLWQLRGDISRWRGWPRQAEKDYRHAARLTSPEDRHAAEDGVLLSRLERGQWRGTVKNIEKRLREDPPSVMRDSLRRNLKEERAGGLVVTASRGDSEGPDVQSSKDWRYEARLEAPRNDAGSRFFARRIGLYGEYEGDDLYAAYTSAGYEFNLYPATLSLEAGNGNQLNDDPLLWGNLTYDFSDHWSAELGVEINSAETPLRALRDGVNADLYRLEASYRRDEAGTGSLGLALMDLDDGNLRRAIQGNWSEELYHWDRWQVIGELSAGASRNDTVEASYFNPERDTSVNGRVETAYSLPLGYRKTFTQTLTLGAGHYWQKNFGNDDTWEIGYGHRWALAPDLTLEYGVTRQRAVYDGDPEYDNSISAGLEWRFL